MVNLLTTVEQKIVSGIKSELGKLTAAGKAEIAKELSWMNGHPWYVLASGIVIGALAVWLVAL